MKQTQLFYLSKNDLMISVIYDKLETAASYKCHRVMSVRETALIEKYIEVKVLEAPHSIIVYFGEDDELQKTWDEFHSIDRNKGDSESPRKTWTVKDEELKDKYKKEFLDDLKNESVSKDDLIKKIHDKYPDKKELLANLQSFLLEGINTKKIKELKENADKGFCFDRIGDILRDRNENHPEEPDHRMEELELYVKEFNKLTNKTITIKSLIK